MLKLVNVIELVELMKHVGTLIEDVGNMLILLCNKNFS